MTTPAPSRHGDPIPWRGLLRLRIVVIACVAMGSLIARIWLGDAVPLGWLFGLIVLWSLSQGTAARSRTTPGAPSLAGLMAVDIAALAIVFHWTGGPANPFTFLTLIYLALAAIVLPPAWAWTIGLWSAAAFGLLFLLPPPEDPHAHHHGHDAGAMLWHLRGMWVGYVLAGAAILGFVGRIARSLAERDRDLADAREQAARSAQLASLATLSAGAAHELGNPLSTIAIVSRELDRQLSSQGASADVLEDVRLIHGEVTRCRQVLERLRADAGDPAGEAPSLIAPIELLQQAADGLDGKLEVEVAPHTPERVGLFAQSSIRALRDVIRNALQASPDQAVVRILADADGPHLRVRVVDQGPGMDPATAARAVEPFFTTRPAGHGMGLGLFLARTVVERTGGRLQIDTQPNQGTTVTLLFAPVTA